VGRIKGERCAEIGRDGESMRMENEVDSRFV